MYVAFTDNTSPEVNELQSEELDCVPSKGDIIRLRDGIFRQVIGLVWAYSKNDIMMVAVGTKEIHP